MNDNRCVCCGEQIPEGSMVCVSCQRKAGKAEGVRNDHRLHRKDVGGLDHQSAD